MADETEQESTEAYDEQLDWVFVPRSGPQKIADTFRSRDGIVEAYVKWDGCVELSFTDRNNADKIHICDLDDFIVRLQKLRKLAEKHFAFEDGWPG